MLQHLNLQINKVAWGESCCEVEVNKLNWCNFSSRREKKPHSLQEAKLFFWIRFWRWLSPSRPHDVRLEQNLRRAFYWKASGKSWVIRWKDGLGWQRAAVRWSSEKSLFVNEIDSLIVLMRRGGSCNVSYWCLLNNRRKETHFSSSCLHMECSQRQVSVKVSFRVMCALVRSHFLRKQRL